MDKIEHENALASLMALMVKEPAKGTEEADQLELLSVLIDQYESKNFPIDLPNRFSAITLTNNSLTTKRRELDFYPTPPDVTHALMDFLEINPCAIWEPACGDGSMSKAIESYGHRVHSTDIRHTGYGTGGIDFLSTELNDIDAIITNPPFNISEEFIRHALSISPIVAMLLKSQYWHAAKRIKLFRKHPPSYVLPLSWRPDFLFNERKIGEKASPTMDVCWSVWIQGDTDTKYRILEKSHKRG